MARRHIEEGTRVVVNPMYTTRQRNFITGGKYLYSGAKGSSVNITQIPIGALGTVTSIGTYKPFLDSYKRYLVDFDDIGPLWVSASDVKNV